MNLLLDTCVWGGAIGELVAAGQDVVWSGNWTEDPGDEEILARAHGERRILVTLDKDFGELAIVRGQPHSGIIRLAGISARRQAQITLQILSQYGAELAQGAIVTVEIARVRIRPPQGQAP